MLDQDAVECAAEAVSNADGLLIAAGAGMGVDSGLPDFRSREGFWRAYPPFEKLGLDFYSLANPHWFRADPPRAWGFYGHRLNLYRRTAPHDGFRILLTWVCRMRHGAFVFTSNVDGHFQRAGFDPECVVEIHGVLNRIQCTRRCGAGPFSAADLQVRVDEMTMRACPPLPLCPACGALARPNVLMFGDLEWDERHTAAQTSRMERWVDSVRGRRVVILECGAGTAVPTVRRTSEALARSLGATLIRINTREPEAPEGQISLPMSALTALLAISERM